MKQSNRFKRSVHLINLKAQKAMKKAVAEAIQDHARTGDPMVIWRDGKVVWISAVELRRQRRFKD